MKFRIYSSFIILFPMIILALSLFSSKCYSCGSGHTYLSLEYSNYSLDLPSGGLNGPPYSPPGFYHDCSATPLASFWAKVSQYVTGSISCGYRCPVHNAELPNASPTSYHMYGCAADVTGQSYSSLNGLFEKVIDETTHIHIDDRTY